MSQCQQPGHRDFIITLINPFRTPPPPPLYSRSIFPVRVWMTELEKHICLREIPSSCEITVHHGVSSNTSAPLAQL